MVILLYYVICLYMTFLKYTGVNIKKYTYILTSKEHTIATNTYHNNPRTKIIY